MAIKVGINGFGRIGRVAARILADRADEFDLCAINLRKADLDHMVYMFKYDSVFGTFKGTVEAGENALIINGKEVKVLSCDDPAQIPWAANGVDYVIESTGAFNTTAKASAHLQGGAKKVIITAPPKDSDTPTYVMGVNTDTYDPKYDVVSNASCTTNCLAPLVKVINDKFGIKEGLMTTVHSSTSKQATVDSRSAKDWRIGRSVYENIIPTTTGAAKACALVIPEVKGKLTGMAMRIPAADVSVVDLTVSLETPTTYEEICAAVKEASEGHFKGSIKYCEDAIVSCDVRGDSCPCVFDVQAGIMLNDHFVKLIAWYDNEWGYTCKVIDLVKLVAESCGE